MSAWLVGHAVSHMIFPVLDRDCHSVGGMRSSHYGFSESSRTTWRKASMAVSMCRLCMCRCVTSRITVGAAKEPCTS